MLHGSWAAAGLAEQALTHGRLLLLLRRRRLLMLLVLRLLLLRDLQQGHHPHLRRSRLHGVVCPGALLQPGLGRAPGRGGSSPSPSSAISM